MFEGLAIGAAICAFEAERERLRARDEARERARKSMSPGEFAEYMRAVEAAEREATEERRHQERCEAIRSTSFWRFGG